LLRTIYDGTGTFLTTVVGWKAVVAQVEALLSDLAPFYCSYDFSVYIALSLLQFVPYSLPPLLSLIFDGIGSFMTSVKRWKGVVARVEALLSDFATLLLPLRFFSAYSIVAHLIRSVFVYTIAKIHRWWYVKIQKSVKRWKGVVAREEALSDLPPFYCSYDLSVRSVFVSTIAKIHLWWYWKLHDEKEWLLE
jgi:hypothetical protein